MHSNGSSLISQVGDNTYATTVGRLKYPWLNAVYLKARGSDRFISSFSQQMSSVSNRARLRHSWICRWHADLRPLCHRLNRLNHHLTSRLADCIDSIGVWMTNNRLKLNASKTEFIWFGSARRLAKCTFESIVINGSSILPFKTARSVGVVLDPSLSLASHVTKLTSTLYFHIRQLRTIRRTLTNDACHALVRALVLSRLNYCNGLLAKAPDNLLAQLSGVMRAAARLILQLPRQSYVSDAIRRQLHWHDISERVRFKLCVLARRCIHGMAPSYLPRYLLYSGQLDRRPITPPFCRIWRSVHSSDEHCTTATVSYTVSRKEKFSDFKWCWTLLRDSSLVRASSATSPLSSVMSSTGSLYSTESATKLPYWLGNVFTASARPISVTFVLRWLQPLDEPTCVQRRVAILWSLEHETKLGERSFRISAPTVWTRSLIRSSILLQAANIFGKNWKLTCLGKPTHQPLRTIEEWTYLLTYLLTVTIGPRAFAVACPAAWNSLPPELHAWQKHKSYDVPEETENLFNTIHSKIN